MYRQFSLLVPIQGSSQPPAELADGFPLTKAYFNELENQQKAYNDKCVDELKEMNQNKITNIIDSGGIEGWHESGNLDSLTKSF